MNIKSLKPAFTASVTDRLAVHTPSLAIAGLAISLLMTSCTTAKAPPTMAFFPQKTISAIGYGTVEKSDRYSRSQIKLMAMRASKMDAYRSLAEQLNGIQLRGQTTVGDAEVTHDNYQIFLNAYLRGARVKRTSAIGSDIYAGDDTFETVVELDLTPRFYECINGPSELMNQCLQQNMESPASNTDDSPSKVSSINGYNYPNTKGFNNK
ncbi:LPP20 family lipoprotein [Methylobacter sp.]|uniref:LPP20 family lipoprotein n=1 Tax=Methylobacter sp. TaxID=2051955 RepID=UPI002FDDFFB9